MNNPNTIDWTHCQDIQVNDVSLRDSFNNFISNGQYKEAIQLLRTSQDQLKGKAYISDIIIKIVNGILYLQSNYDQNVNIFLSDLAQKHKKIIDSLVLINPWNNTVQYNFYNFVMYQDEIYMAIGIPEIGVSPDVSKDWLYLGLKGENGRPGININMKTAWSSAISYRYRDVVAYGDDLYYALKDNKEITPGTDELTWMLFIKVSKGGIHIGINSPEQAGKNTVWFKTEKDPLIVSGAVNGQFYRYNTNASDHAFNRSLTNKNGQVFDDWDLMYPATLFKLISGTEVYTDKATFIKLDIQPGDWGFKNEEYIYSLTNNKIVGSKFVEVIYGSKLSVEQFNYYSGLSIQVIDNAMNLTIKSRPLVNLPLTVIIQ